MLNRVFLFLRHERVYLLLIVLIGVFYAAITTGTGRKIRASQAVPSQAMEEFKAAERQFNEQSFSGWASEEFRNQNPLLTRSFEFFTLFFLLAIVAGLGVDFILLVRPSLRKKLLYRPDPPPVREWPFSILLRTVVLFITWGIVLSVAIGLLESFFLKTGSENLLMILHTLILDVLGLILVVYFLKKQGSSWRELGFNIPQGKVFREMGIGITGYLGTLPLFVLVLMALMYFSSLFSYEPPPHPLVNVFVEEEKRQPFLVIFSILFGAVIGPVFEEIFFRGFCYPILKGKIGKVGAMVVSSAFFASIHHTGFVFWPIFILGMALAYLYETRRSLLAPMTLHVVHNSLLIGYFFLAKQVISSSHPL